MRARPSRCCWQTPGVQTVQLTWQQAEGTAVVLAALGGSLALSPRRRVRAAGALVREVATIGVLYGLWRLAGTVALLDNGGAYDRARWIQDVQRDLLLPSERSVQELVLGHSWLVQGANLYYATMHMTMMLVFLFWLFVRHRDQYRPVRQVMAWTSLACLAVQLVPVAPPRLVPGFVDTATLHGQSVYSSGGIAADQLAAMPSVHVAWAVLIGFYTWRISPSRWRVVGAVHAVVTVFVVVATANHWWLDGVVGVAILAVCAWAVRLVQLAWHRSRGRGRSAARVHQGAEQRALGARHQSGQGTSQHQPPEQGHPAAEDQPTGDVLRVVGRDVDPGEGHEHRGHRGDRTEPPIDQPQAGGDGPGHDGVVGGEGPVRAVPRENQQAGVGEGPPLVDGVDDRLVHRHGQ